MLFAVDIGVEQQIIVDAITIALFIFTHFQHTLNRLDVI